MIALLFVLLQTVESFEPPFRVRDADGEIEVPEGGAAPCFADVDGDELEDLLVGNADGRVRLYRNVGERGRPKFAMPVFVRAGDVDARVPSGDGSVFSPNLVDVTGDGFPDLVSGSWYSRSALVFEGCAAHTFAPPKDLVPFERRGALVDDGSTVALGDWDGDGDTDLVSCDHWGELHLLTNLASARTCARFDAGRALRASDEELTADWEGAPRIVDWNGDGLADLVLGAADGSLRLFPGRKGGELGVPTFLLSPPDREAVLVPDRTRGWSVFAQRPQRSLRPCVGDWNHDGRLDLIIGDDVWATGPAPVLDRKQETSKRELERDLRELDDRRYRIEDEVERELLLERGVRREQLANDPRLANDFEDELGRRKTAHPRLRALRTARAAFAAELEPFLAPSRRRSTVWVCLRRAEER